MRKNKLKCICTLNIFYIYCMQISNAMKKDKKDYTTIRIRKEDHKKLRILAAINDKTILETVGELADQGLKK